MRTMILALVISFVFASPVHASPLTWLFSGTTRASSQFNGMPVGGEQFELRIFLDTNLVGMKVPGLADVFFGGPRQGEVAIDTLGVLPLNAFLNVQYFAGGPGDSVTGVQYVESLAGFSGIQFGSPISTDSLHLGPIAPTTPKAPFDTLSLSGPNGLIVSGEVTTFSAVATAVPEGGSTALFLTSALIASWLLWHRRRSRRGTTAKHGE